MEVDYQAIQGYRAKRTHTFASDPNSKFIIMLLALILEPLQFLIGWFFHASSNMHSGSRRYPPSVDMASDESSPVSALMRHLAALIFYATDRVAIVWMFFADTFQEWRAQFASQYRQCRRVFSSGLDVADLNSW